MSRPIQWPEAAAPVAEVRVTTRALHDVQLVDSYGWLRDDNWRDVLKDPARLAPDIRAYLEAENRHAAALLAPTEALQERLIAEMRGRIREDDAEPAVPDGAFAYYTRYRSGGDYALVCRQPRWGGEEMLLLDGDAEAKGHGFFQLGRARHSPDHRLLAWAADTRGSEYFTIRVRDLATGEDHDSVPDTTGRMVWLRDSSGFLYVRYDEDHRDREVYLHRLGSAVAEDVLLHREEAPGFFIRLSATQDGAFVTLTIADHETGEVRLVDPADPLAPPRLVAPRQQGVLYEVDRHQGDLIIRTNAGGATDFKLVRAPVARPDRDNWQDLVPHRPGRLILSHVAFARHLVWQERAEALPSVQIRRWVDGVAHSIAFDEPAYTLSASPGYEADTDTLRFTYASLSTPPETYDYDMESRRRTLIKRRELPSGHVPADYVVERLMARAGDCAEVPVSLLYRRGLARDESAPLLLYGYGAYGIAIGAGFRSGILSLVDRGFVYAIAHVRGGMDKGFSWYEDGKRAKKTNTFTDFLAAAEALIAAGYTRAGRIVAQGGSAGGMLMGAIANMRPELFAGIVAEVPFVDVLNTMLDKDLPLTPPEWPEWGNPIDSAADFAAIRAYSPYDNVGAQRYPAMLIEAGLTDPRVTYWEPAKWVARLRATMTGGGPILLRTDMAAGHGGQSGRLKRLADEARVQAFALMATGLA